MKIDKAHIIIDNEIIENNLESNGMQRKDSNTEIGNDKLQRPMMPGEMAKVDSDIKSYRDQSQQNVDCVGMENNKIEITYSNTIMDSDRMDVNEDEDDDDNVEDDDEEVQNYDVLDSSDQDILRVFNEKSKSESTSVVPESPIIVDEPSVSKKPVSQSFNMSLHEGKEEEDDKIQASKQAQWLFDDNEIEVSSTEVKTHISNRWTDPDLFHEHKAAVKAKSKYSIELVKLKSRIFAVKRNIVLHIKAINKLQFPKENAMYKMPKVDLPAHLVTVDDKVSFLLDKHDSLQHHVEVLEAKQAALRMKLSAVEHKVKLSAIFKALSDVNADIAEVYHTYNLRNVKTPQNKDRRHMELSALRKEIHMTEQKIMDPSCTPTDEEIDALMKTLKEAEQKLHSIKEQAPSSKSEGYMPNFEHHRNKKSVRFNVDPIHDRRHEQWPAPRRHSGSTSYSDSVLSFRSNRRRSIEEEDVNEEVENYYSDSFHNMYVKVLFFFIKYIH